MEQLATECEDCAQGTHSTRACRNKKTGGETGRSCVANATHVIQNCTDPKAYCGGPRLCTKCAAGKKPSAFSDSCVDCKAGKFSKEGQPECGDCLGGTFSRVRQESCSICPETPGIKCPGGVLTPQDNWWSPSVLLGEKDRKYAKPFNQYSKLYRCTKEETCFANVTDGTAEPLDAFKCRKNHEGVLCNSCSKMHFMRNDRCIPCTAGISPAAKGIAVAFAVFLLSMSALFLVLRKNKHSVKRRLLLESIELKEARNAVTRKLSVLSAFSTLSVGSGGVSSSADSATARRRRKSSFLTIAVPTSLSKEHAKHHFRLHVILRMRAYSLEACHTMMKAAEGGDLVGETFRIVVGFGQVMHHLVRKRCPLLYSHIELC